MILFYLALLAFLVELLHNFMVRFLEKNKRHEKNWVRIQRNDVREIFLYFLSLKRKVNDLKADEDSTQTAVT